VVRKNVIYMSVLMVCLIFSNGCNASNVEKTLEANQYVGQGIHALEQYQYAKAEDLFKRSIKLNHNNADAHYFLALTYRELGYKADKVVYEFMMALELDNKHSDAYRDLGIYYGLIGKMDEAKKYLMDALRLNESDVPTIMNIANIYASRAEYQKARNLYEKAISINSKSSSLWYKYGRLLIDMGEYDKAEESLNKVFETSPGHPFAYKYLAEIEKIRGDEEGYLDYKKKEEVAQKALEKKIANRYNE
jgi:Tfp pilus assembly protein PilF